MKIKELGSSLTELGMYSKRSEHVEDVKGDDEDNVKPI